MEGLQLYQSSDGSDDDSSDKKVDFFNLRQSQADEITYCEHFVDRKECWKCDMMKYEKERLQIAAQRFGPEPQKRTHTNNTRHIFNKYSRLNESLSSNGLDYSGHGCNVQISCKDFESVDTSKCISELNWNPSSAQSSSLLSCTMDGNIKIWNLNGRRLKKECDLDCSFTKRISRTAVRSCKWSIDGNKIFTGDFDCNVKIIDAATGKEEATFAQSNHITSLCVHPSEENMVLSGSTDKICLWDIRISNAIPVRQYRGKFGQVRDIAFLKGASEFVCCTDHVEKESADRTIMAWHYRSAALLSNQIYHERYSCTSLRTHPTDNIFLAQTNGNYIAVFSSVNPYKMYKKKRFDGHKVSGYGITFDVSSDGRVIASGSSDGNAHFYDYKTTRKKFANLVFEKGDPCFAVKFHPLLHSLVALGSWSGAIRLWQSQHDTNSDSSSY